MPPHDIAPLIIGMTLILSVAGIIILRPLARRLGDLIELRSRAKEQQPEVQNEQIERLTELVGHLTDRLESLEERQEFAERLLMDQDSTPAAAELKRRSTDSG
jgi:hypothetical protein